MYRMNSGTAMPFCPRPTDDKLAGLFDELDGEVGEDEDPNLVSSLYELHQIGEAISCVGNLAGYAIDGYTMYNSEGTPDGFIVIAHVTSGWTDSVRQVTPNLEFKDWYSIEEWAELEWEELLSKVLIEANKLVTNAADHWNYVGFQAWRKMVELRANINSDSSAADDAESAYAALSSAGLKVVR